MNYQFVSCCCPIHSLPITLVQYNLYQNEKLRQYLCCEDCDITLQKKIDYLHFQQMVINQQDLVKQKIASLDEFFQLNDYTQQNETVYLINYYFKIHENQFVKRKILIIEENGNRIGIKYQMESEQSPEMNALKQANIYLLEKWLDLEYVPIKQPKHPDQNKNILCYYCNQYNIQPHSDPLLGPIKSKNSFTYYIHEFCLYMSDWIIIDSNGELDLNSLTNQDQMAGFCSICNKKNATIQCGSTKPCCKLKFHLHCYKQMRQGRESTCHELYDLRSILCQDHMNSWLKKE